MRSRVVFLFTSTWIVNYTWDGSLLVEADTRVAMVVSANTATRLIRFNKAITWLKRASAQVVALGVAQRLEHVNIWRYDLKPVACFLHWTKYLIDEVQITLNIHRWFAKNVTLPWNKNFVRNFNSYLKLRSNLLTFLFKIGVKKLSWRCFFLGKSSRVWWFIFNYIEFLISCINRFLIKFDSFCAKNERVPIVEGYGTKTS